MRLPEYLNDAPGSTLVMSGNEAMARGAVEAGVHFATAYPGTPSTEILQSLVPAARPYGVRVEWAINEKVGFEAAVAVSLLGLRAMVSMKHVGLNWISDPLLAVNLSGIRGGLVVVVADDPGSRSSHNEQDSRYYGFLAEIPILEPAGPAEARDAVRDAFELAEDLRLPVIVRSVARVSHAREAVALGEIRPLPRQPVFERDERFLVTGAGGRALRLHQELHARQEDVIRASEECPFNVNEVAPGAPLGVITSGLAFNYVREALKGLGGTRPALLKAGMVFPAPRGPILGLARRVPKLLVVEEGEPVLELQVRTILNQGGLATPVSGRHTGDIAPVGELTTEQVRQALAKALGLESPARVRQLPAMAFPRRELTMCAGCPHRATLFALKRVVDRLGRANSIICGDIGCYSFGSQPPFELVDAKYTMGASLGLACGFGGAGLEQKVFAVIGDSTFLHAGIPALINAAYNGAKAIVVIVDNETVAMTGQQPHPGTGVRATGEPGYRVRLEDIARAAGASLVRAVDAYDIDQVEETLAEAAAHDGLAVVISRRECALSALRKLARQGAEPGRHEVDETECSGCGVCVTELACPALGWDGDTAAIIAMECTGCGVCARVCPVGAIRKAGEGR